MWFSLYHTFLSCSSQLPDSGERSGFGWTAAPLCTFFFFFFCITAWFYPCTLQSQLTGRRKGGKKNYRTLIGESAAGNNIPSGNECVWIEVVAWAGLPVVKAAQISWEGKSIIMCICVDRRVLPSQLIAPKERCVLRTECSYLLFRLSFHVWMQQVSLFLWTSLLWYSFGWCRFSR